MDKYWPGDIAEAEPHSRPVGEDIIELRPGQAAASLYALLVGLRNQAKALVERLETRGVHVAKDEQRATVRELYVQTKRQVQALSAVLELEGLE